MSCRIILEINNVYLNGTNVEGLTCLASIHNCAEVSQAAEVPFPDKMMFNIPNFQGYIVLVFSQEGRNLCKGTFPLTTLFDRDTNQLELTPFENDPRFQTGQPPRFKLNAIIRAVYPEDILKEGEKAVTNVFESKSLLSEAEKTEDPQSVPPILLVSKTITPNNVNYEEKKIWETLVSGAEPVGDIIQIREEILQINKILNDEDEVIHQTKNTEEKETNKRAKDHVLLVNRRYDSLIEIDKELQVVDRHDDFRETRYEADTSNPRRMRKSIEGYHTTYTPEGDIMQREEYKQENAVEEQPGADLENNYEELLQKKIRIEQLLYDIESKFYGQLIDQDTIAVIQTLKRVLGEIMQAKLTQAAIESDEDKKLLESQMMNMFRSASSPPIMTHDLPYLQSFGQQPQPTHPQQQAPFDKMSEIGQPQHTYDSGNILVEPTYPVEEGKGVSYGPRRLPGEEEGISYAPKISSQKALDAEKNQGTGAFSSPETNKYNTLREMYKKVSSSKKSPEKIPPNADYVMDLKHSLAFAATNFIDDELCRSIVFQMSLNKKKIIPVTVKKSIPLGGKDEVKITARNYFDDKCPKKYLHYFEPGTKNLYLFNVTKKLLEDTTNPQNFERVELDIDFDISPHHRSIITPSGFIYLVSGEPAYDPDQASGSCHLFNYNNNTLIKKASMNHSTRKDFGLIYFNRNLFVCGGVVKGQITNSCERYDTRKDEWMSIAPMGRAVKHPALCLFANRYIFRFFGINSYGIIDQTIERFDGQKNKWIDVTPERKTPLHGIYLPMCYQITEDHIFVFGGKNENDFDSVKCEGYLVKVDDKKTQPTLEVIKTKNQIPGFAGLLNYNSLFLQDNTLYTMREGI